MKKFIITITSLFVTILTIAQVGIGTNIPVSGSILELKAADKALLLTRVATTASVATPVNGMMVYDISSNCIKGYQNGAWTGCLSSCGAASSVSGGGDFGLDFTSTMKQISATYDANGANAAGCVTTDGKVFYWGRNYYSSMVISSATIVPTPVYLPLPNGEVANKISLGGYCIMALTTAGNVYIMGSDGTPPAFGGFATVRVWTKIVISGESTFTDASTTPYGRDSFLLGSSGKVYRCGQGINVSASTYTQMLFPSGVTSYSAIWTDQIQASDACIFLKGNDNAIYACGANYSGELGIGSTATVEMNATPVKVQFPTGVTIAKISCTSYGICLAVSSTGIAYGWGKWNNGAATPLYNFAATPIAGDISGNKILKPSPINLPTLNGDTKFTDVLVGYGYTAVKTDKMVYYKGENKDGVVMNPGTSDQQNYGSGSAYSIDTSGGSNYNVAAPVWNKFKTIITGGASHAAIYAISESDKGYVWGNFSYGNAGIGAGQGSSQIYKPMPIGTGIGDPVNPNPLY
ncbi:MAG: hypothetical protein RIQ59_1118 [Bacteroidota bacterium]|jgi:alpha-tubulin suppressor-like RCC1 family protein